MKFFIDSSDLNEIKEAFDLGVCEGVTTNPSLIAKSSKDFKSVLFEICQEVDGPVSAEVIAVDYETMLKEAFILKDIHKNIVIKLPLTQDGLKACHALSKKGIQTNVTLCFSANQALLAAKCGASYISPFLGRLDDCGHDGIQLLKTIGKIYETYGFQTKILGASIRHAKHVLDAALAGAHVVTCPLKVIKDLYKHPLTSKGLEMFLDDWKASKQKAIS